MSRAPAFINGILLTLAATLVLGGWQTPAPSPSLSAATPSAVPAIQPPSSGYRFPAGQTFTYSVDWRLFTAGTTAVRFDSVGEEQRINADADSVGAVALLYHVHDRIESSFDPKNNCTLSLTKHTEEGFRRVETTVHYDYDRKKSVLDEKNLRANNQKHEENDIPGCVTDVISAVYYVASQPLTVGQKLLFPVNDGGKTAEVQVEVEGREQIKAPYGAFKTVRVSAQALSGPQKGKGRIWMWYSDDDRRLPIQMRAKMFWGTLTFHLTQVSSQPPARAALIVP
jgi:Protein of unknown function (DUF3108).